MHLPKFFNGNLNEIVSPLFGANYFIGLMFSFLIVSSLFVFRRFYAKTSQQRYFGIAIGSFQILLYIFYFLFHQLSGDITWKDYFPFQICSVLNLTSALLLIFPMQKVFNVTFPLVGPVFLAFLFPDASKRVYGPDNFFFYQYYLNHTIILFTYFYLFFYGHVSYNGKKLKESITIITMFSLMVFLFNISFGTNYLFIGDVGYSIGVGNFMIDTATWLPIFRFLFMYLIGLSFLLPFHYLAVKRFKPLYFDSGKEKTHTIKTKKLSFVIFVLKKLKNVLATKIKPTKRN